MYTLTSLTLSVVVCLSLLPGATRFCAGAADEDQSVATKRAQYGIALFLPDGWETDTPWLVQVRDALLLVVENVSAELKRNKADWELFADVPGTRPVQNTKHVLLSGSEEGKGNPLLRALDVLCCKTIIAFIVIQSDTNVRTLSSLARPLSLPVITTNTNHLLPAPSARFPTLLRTVQDDKWLYVAIKELLVQFNWRRIAVIHALDTDYDSARTLTANIRELSFDSVAVEALVKPQLIGDSLSPATVTELEDAKRKHIKVFVVCVQANILPILLEFAKSNGMLGVANNFVWIASGLDAGPRLYPSKLWHLLEGVLVFRPHADLARLNMFSQLLSQPTGTKLGTVSHAAFNEVSLQAAYTYDIAQAVVAGFSSWKRDHDAEKTRKTSAGCILSDLPGCRKNAFEQLDNGAMLVNDITEEWTNGSDYSYIPYADFDNYDLFVVNSDTQLVLVGQWWGKSLSFTYPHGANASCNTDLMNSPALQEVWHGRIPLDKPFQLTTIRVLVHAYHPFIYLKSNSSNATSIDSYAGPLADTWRNISAWYGLNYTISHWNGTNLDQFLANSCAMPAEGRFWDVILGGVSSNTGRTTHSKCQFSLPFHSNKLRATYLRPQASGIKLWVAVQPFKFSLWVESFGLIAVCVVVLVVLDQKGMATNRNGNILADAIFFGFSAFLGFGEHRIKRFWARLFVLVFQFWLLIMVANLTAIMVRKWSDMDKLEDALKLKPLAMAADFEGKKVGYRRGSDSGQRIVDKLRPGEATLVPVDRFDDIGEMLEEKKFDIFISSGPLALFVCSKNCLLTSKALQVCSYVILSGVTSFLGQKLNGCCFSCWD